ncbi:MAG: biotin--[acetyl-CoA-carboxylase] ligase [Oligoflexia bacterium]|nr:biotin--[acetyl-CoA-carboxylase] ligase [Oligoflexia bacterium]
MKNAEIPLQLVEKCESTNSYLLENWDIKRDPITAVLTFDQTKGRGRGNNSWSFYPGNLALSIGLRLTKNEPSSLYPFLLAASVASALEESQSKRVLLKWPNDLYLNRKKVGGILSQARQADVNTYLVLGLGLNVVKAPELLNARYQATSFLAEGISLDAHNFARDVLVRFQRQMHLGQDIFALWEKYADLPQKISILGYDEIFYAYGLSNNGGLKVRSQETNVEKILFSEEITLLGD